MIFIRGRYFKRFEVPRDGNCVFSALSYVVYKDLEHAAVIRSETVDIICGEWEEYKKYTDKGENSSYESSDEYRAAMSKQGTYGAFAEILAAARLFDVPIIVYADLSAGGLHVAAVANRTGNQRPVYIYFEEQTVHYTALEPEFFEWFLPEVEEDVMVTSSGSNTTLDTGTRAESPPSYDTSESEVESDLSDENPDSDSEEVSSGVSIGSSLRRPRPFTKLPTVFKSRPSHALPRYRYGDNFMWAGMFAGENTRDVEEISIGGFNAFCPEPLCNALYFEAERLNVRGEVPFWCCNKSTRALLSERGIFQDIKDDAVRELYYGTSDDAKHFQANIRAYNHVLTTAVPIVKYGRVRQRGQSIVTVNGKVTFQSPSRPVLDNGLPSTSGQLFFVDLSVDTLARRTQLSYGPDLDENIVLTLETYLRRYNDFVRTFELAGMLEKRIAEIEGNSVNRRDVMLYVNPHAHGFRTTDRELIASDSNAFRPDNSGVVAAVFVGSRPHYNYDVVMYPRNDQTSKRSHATVDVASPMLDTMLYPLIHLHAEDSFIAAEPRSNMDPDYHYHSTLRQYYSCRLMSYSGRPDGDSVLFRCKALFQQWLCDAALKIMDSNLNYISKNQDQLTACEFDSLQRFINSVAAENNKRPGRIVILPRGFQKSERRMYHNYLDAVRLSLEFGAPAWFITFTTNPNWHEILTVLRLRGLTSNDYMHAADAVVRSYLARVKILLHDLINRSGLGQVKAYVGVHEFTTSGLPHFHLALILNDQDRPDTPEEVDAFISAEIPDDTDPELRTLVLSLMMHRPCDGSSPDYTNPPCRPNGDPCRHGFPKAFSDVTVLNARGPELRRRQTPPVWHPKFKCLVDNRWTAEYLIKGLKRYKGHVNAKVCGRNMFWKYLFGYMEKSSTGHHVQGTMLTFALKCAQETDELIWDEVDQCRSMRMIGPFESVFSILGEPLTIMSHSIECLPVHLPHKQIVYYKGDPATAANLRENSKLLAWFRLNANNESARDVLYADIIVKYKWRNGEWVPRKKEHPVLGRLMHVNPTPRNLELYHLRLLLLNRRGMKDWSDLLTVNNIQYCTFLEACDAIGVQSGEATVDYNAGIDEVCTHGSPWQIRQYFSTLIAQCFLRNTTEMWIMKKDKMSEDFRRKGSSTLQALHMARDEIIACILQMTADGSTKENLLPLFPIGEVDDIDDYTTADDACVDTEAHVHVENGPSLTDEQQIAFDTIMDAVASNRTGANVFRLTASAGCGKTFLYRALVDEVKRRGGTTICSAFTGIAASLLPEGETCHRTFGIPVRSRLTGTERSFIERLSTDGNLLEAASLILVDEASMLSKVHAQIIDHLLRMLTGKLDTVCGGKVVVFGGDMGQILPVVEGVPPSSNDQYALSSWEYWRTCKTITLTRNMRASSDPDFADWLTKVRDGTANFNESDDIILPDDIVVANPGGIGCDERPLMEALVKKVYADFSLSSMKSAIILAPTNDVVKELNQMVLDKITGRSRVYLSNTSLDMQDKPSAQSGFELAQDELDNISPPRLPPHRLVLKKHAVVMLLINLNKKAGLCNGTRLEVVSMWKEVVLVRRITPHHGVCDEFFLPKMIMTSDDVPVAGSIRRIQFPVSLAMCITINKGQGQTYRNVGVYLRRPVFAHGQFFVAVSRAMSRRSLSIAVVDRHHQGRVTKGSSHKRKSTFATKTKNIVHRHLLR